MKKKKFKLATLGCRTNQYETQAYRDQLLQMGYQEAKGEDEADLCIVNTCTVTEGADRHSRHQIRHLLREHKKANVVVTGCMAEGKADMLQKMGERVVVVPNRKKERLIADLFHEEEVPEFSIKNFEAHTRAFVKVQDGCNSFCTYCIIPYVRGRSRSRPLPEVVDEVKRLVASGFREVVITGINVGDYQDGEQGLADLVRSVDAVEGLSRVRLSSIDPDEVDDSLMDAIVNGKNTCPCMHIVLQSGSNVILKRMNRKYNRQIFLNTIQRLKKASPTFTFTTDIIVGFPDETEMDFKETMEVVQEVKFAKVHMFPYSPRERTRAALYKNQVAQEVVKRRKQELLDLSDAVAFDLREQYVGKEATVLIENSRENFLYGHTDNFLKVTIPKKHFRPNELVKVQLNKNTLEGLVGEAL
ncbi:MAG: tRNA (N(6)-L-threonylcarbamoyladenosine(37)-C(2))-methylthiotransferase MtaB [Chlamydiales bacterium]